MILNIDMGKDKRNKKGVSLLSFPTSYTVIDLETTGLDPQWNDIIEFGAIRVENGSIVSRFSSLVNPGYEIDGFITELTGITNEMLSSAPAISEILPCFINFVANSVIIGHNVNFDINFLYDNCSTTLHMPFSNNYVDTMRLSRRLFHQEKHHRLQDLIGRFKIAETIEHRALSDAEHTNRCYMWMKQYIEDNHIDINSLLFTRNSISAKDIHADTDVFDANSPLYNRTFVFTGVLERMARKEAMQLVMNLGGKCGDGVNRDTNFLVLGNNDYCTTIKDGKSTKQKKAELLKLEGTDIEIISENVFYDMITSSTSR